MTEEKDLLILGNGFDIACGLKTSYLSFFEKRYNGSLQKYCNRYWEKFEDLPEDYRKYFESRLIYYLLNDNQNYSKLYIRVTETGYGLENMDLNRWDFVFLISELLLSNDVKDILWYDVENIIYEIVSIIYVKDYKNNRLSFVKDTDFNDKLWVIGNNDLKELFEEYRVANRKTGSGENTCSVIYEKCIKKIFANDSDDSDVIDPEEALRDLNTFERRFSAYVVSLQKVSKDNNETQAINEKYKSAYTNLIKKIIHDEGVEKQNESEKFDLSNFKIAGNYNVDILSFNYTPCNMFTIPIDRALIHSIVNIHGRARFSNYPDNNGYDKAEIVFGIGDNEIVKNTDFQNDKRLIFTKELRILRNRYIKNIKFINGWDKIRIYGHSLGEADYSYFISIFDKCDLYNSDVQLVFYFYDDGKESTISAFYKKVYDLITSYGMANSNPYGSHIMNKLILENRIKILPAPQLDATEKIM